MDLFDESLDELSLTRRGFVASLTALGLGAVNRPLQAQVGPTTGQASQPERTDRIDVHHHIVPRSYVEAMNRAGFGTIGGVPFAKWEPEVLERSFDVLGIRKAIVSVSSPGVAVNDQGLERELSREINEYSAGLIRDFAPRAGAFATIPMSSSEAAIAESGYALDELGLNGLSLFSNHHGRYLGDPALDEYMDYLNRREAIVFLHPTLPLKEMWPAVSIDPPLIEFVFETTRAIANMLFNGVFERFPRIRFIVAHSGGTIPFVAWRLRLFEHSSRQEFKDFRQRCPRPIHEYLASLYYEVAVSCSPGNLRDLLSFVPVEHILFGTDYPFAAQSFIDMNTASLTGSGVLDEKGVEMVSSKNAERLFNLVEA
jgi:predicted TIM-barrel fold metal-dependent hydrolase